jgi:hypothetical protein
MTDSILRAYLERQYRDGLELAQASDVLSLVPVEGSPPQRYLAEFRCTGLVHTPSGGIAEAHRFVVGIWFPDDYLRHVNPFQVLTWLAPRNVWHPNVSNCAPFVCVGRLVAATPLVDILYQLFEIITYRKVTPREDDALNREACAWARANMARFPIYPHSLKRRPADAEPRDASAETLDFDVVEVTR